MGFEQRDDDYDPFHNITTGKMRWMIANGENKDWWKTNYPDVWEQMLNEDREIERKGQEELHQASLVRKREVDSSLDMPKELKMIVFAYMDSFTVNESEFWQRLVVDSPKPLSGVEPIQEEKVVDVKQDPTPPKSFLSRLVSKLMSFLRPTQVKISA